MAQDKSRVLQGAATGGSTMDPSIWAAIQRGLTCDITTIGRQSGAPRRIEIWYFVLDDTVYISGTPGARDWYANVQANPQIIFHVKQGAHADLPARAEPIVAPAERRRIMARIMAANSYFRGGDLDAWVAGSPLIAVRFDLETSG
jgi:deazaflavin-dependent oxidoreductase (nitroreductase family)